MKNKLNEAMAGMDRAFNTLCKIYVNEDNVERMAVAKQEMRGVFVILKTLRDQQAEAEKMKAEAVEEA